MRQTRVIYSDNGTLNDWSVAINNYHTGSKTFSLVAADDSIYIGQIAPFNHFYVKLGTPNTATSNISVQYYSGSSWNNVAETIDETNGFKNSGFVTFIPDKNQGWVSQDTSGSGGTITELSTVKIYDKYWARINFSADLDASVVIDWIGNIFSNDNDLGSEYPDLLKSNVLTAFQAGKTDWEEQAVRGAELIIDDLIKKKVIYAKGQVLERNTFMLPSISKVAELVYASFGDDYKDNKLSAFNEYSSRMKKSIFDVDKNDDATLNPFEMRIRQGFMTR